MVNLNHLGNNLFWTALVRIGFIPIISEKGRGMNSVLLHTHLPGAWFLEFDALVIARDSAEKRANV
nr:hypothetical protein [uncultured Pedobacter sp.]